MAGSLPGNVRSACFDGDGMTLKDVTVVKDGKAVAYYGPNRFGQYLEETPTGNLRCIQVAPGSACGHCLSAAPYLEVLSMSGLQVDFFNDYIGGEVRLAYYHDGEKLIPVTGISITGSLKQVLSSIRLSQTVGVDNGYQGPDKAILQDMKIF
jgi:PmbA protein